MSQGKIKHVFPGGNTSQGFFSYYEYILAQDEARRIIVIKGGPGVGKSTFMREIGEEMLERGYDVEYMHCSSDNNSLDGVVIPAIKVALMDGTAPHIVDPKNPGAVDEIIHLGDFWDEEGIYKNKEGILRDNSEVGCLFARAYKYLKAAASVYEDVTTIYKAATNSAGVNMQAHQIIDELFGGISISEKEGKVRKLFASAITPGGLKNYLTSVLTTGTIYAITGNPGTGAERFLGKVKQAAIERGHNVECYYCSLNPSKLEHIVIPGIDTSFTTVNMYHSADIAPTCVVDMDDYIDWKIITAHEDELKYGMQMFDQLLERSILTIGKAKTLHDHMEQYYIPHMDFEAVVRCYEATLSRILQYASE